MRPARWYIMESHYPTNTVETLTKGIVLNDFIFWANDNIKDKSSLLDLLEQYIEEEYEAR